MVRLTDIHSLTDFQRNSKEYIERLEKTGQPEILTVNGEAKLVVQDAESYQKILDELERAKTREAMEQALRGEGRPALEFLEELRRKHNIPKKAKG